MKVSQNIENNSINTKKNTDSNRELNWEDFEKQTSS